MLLIYRSTVYIDQILYTNTGIMGMMGFAWDEKDGESIGASSFLTVEIVCPIVKMKQQDLWLCCSS